MTDDIKLLPMPKGEAVGMYQAWSYDQMRDYARANVAVATTTLQAEIEALRAEVDGTIRELLAERNTAREDAERWRALREMDGGEIYALLGDCDGIHPEQADAAIDRARRKGGEEASND